MEIAIANQSCNSVMAFPQSYFASMPVLDSESHQAIGLQLATKDAARWAHRFRVVPAGENGDQACWLAPPRPSARRVCWENSGFTYADCCYEGGRGTCWGNGFSASTCCREIHLKLSLRQISSSLDTPMSGSRLLARVREHAVCPPLGAPASCDKRVSFERDDAYFDAEFALRQLRMALHGSRAATSATWVVAREVVAWQRVLELASLATCTFQWEPCLLPSERTALLGSVCPAMLITLQELKWESDVTIGIGRSSAVLCAQLGPFLRQLGESLHRRLAELNAAQLSILQPPLQSRGLFLVRHAEAVAGCGADKAAFWNLFGRNGRTAILGTWTPSLLEMDEGGNLHIGTLRKVLLALRGKLSSERLRVVNLGANDGSCLPDFDPANCLVFAGQADGLLIEAYLPFAQLLDVAVAAELEARENSEREAPQGHAGYVRSRLATATPESLPGIVRSELPPEWNGEVDLLKVDVDHGDCHFLPPLLSVGVSGWPAALRPRAIYVEINRLYPPPFDFRQRFDAQCNDGLRVLSNGCSLVAFERIGAKFGYRLLRSTVADAFLIRDDLVHQLIGKFPEAELLLNRSLVEHFREGTLCHPHQIFREHLHGSADVRAWADPKLAIETRARQVFQLLKADEAGSCGRGELRWL